MRARDHNSWLRWPERCDQSVVRKGEQEPCNKWAVAVAWYPPDDEFGYHEYPVCKHHARGRPLMSLKDVIRISRESDSKDNPARGSWAIRWRT